jgi:hypothetical protein
MAEGRHTLPRLIATAAAAVVAPVAIIASAPQATATTYTLEPLDYDGVLGVTMNLTQEQLGGTLCPCVKIAYPADSFHNQRGVDQIVATPLQAGDTILAFSNGTSVATLYLEQNTPPLGVKFILLGSDVAGPNGRLIVQGITAWGGPVPADVSVPVNIVTKEYEGWGDFPDVKSAPGYRLAVRNVNVGVKQLHDYRDVDLNDPANIVTVNGNITTTLIPTPTLPINNWLRRIGMSERADQRDARMRPIIDAAYTREGSQTSSQPQPAASTTSSTITKRAAVTEKPKTQKPVVKKVKPVTKKPKQVLAPPKHRIPQTA